MQRTTTTEVRGPWSLAVSRAFWESFTPTALPPSDGEALETVLLAEDTWRPVAATVVQRGAAAEIALEGDGDLEAATAQVLRFLALDVDAADWPEVGRRDPVIGGLQRELPGLRPCGFQSPYEAAVWTVLSQRTRIVQAARLRADLIARHGERGALPSPAVLRGLHLDLPGRRTEYLHAVAEAALDGLLDGAALRAVPPEAAIAAVQQVRGLGPFAAGLVVVRGANAPDALPLQERRLEDEVAHRYGPDAVLEEVAEAWRPFLTWAAVHLRAAREERMRETV